MVPYYQTETRKTYCAVCGDLTLCDALAADYCESETGYLDELVLCPECRREREAHRWESTAKPHRLRPLADIGSKRGR